MCFVLKFTFFKNIHFSMCLWHEAGRCSPPFLLQRGRNIHLCLLPARKKYSTCDIPQVRTINLHKCCTVVKTSLFVNLLLLSVPCDFCLGMGFWLGSRAIWALPPGPPGTSPGPSNRDQGWSFSPSSCTINPRPSLIGYRRRPWTGMSPIACHDHR